MSKYSMKEPLTDCLPSRGIELECFVSLRAFASKIVGFLAHQATSCVFKDDPNPSCNGQIMRATSLVRSALAFSQAIRKDRLPLDELRGVPMCMNQYWWLFGVARVPGDDGGKIRLDPDARHIVVMCRGQIYRLHVLEENSNLIIDKHELSMSLQYIVDDAHSMPTQDASKKSVGLLTTENQKVWSRCRKVMVHEGLKNGRNFSVIDSSLFLLCLDDSSPRSRTDICMNMICGTNLVENGVQIGTCVNRWYDKLALIVCSNGAAGMNFEHTCTDGSVDIGMACEIYEGSISPSEHANNGDSAASANFAATLRNGSSNADTIPAGLQKLAWDIPSEIDAALRLAETHLVDRIQQHQLQTLDFNDFGKTLMTSTGFSPDAFFQMALHAAYYRVYNRIGSGFEPVLMRQYLHGRTDVARTTTPEAAAFARIFSDQKASTAQKVVAMHRAADTHVAIVKDCAKGLSHHRHLYVLQQMWKRRQAFLEGVAMEPGKVGAHVHGNEEQNPQPTTIFADPGWSRLGTTILMGSNVDNPSIAYAGFGPPSAEGFTVCYYIRKDHMAMTVCSRNGEAKWFIDAIKQTFQDIQVMLRYA